MRRPHVRPFALIAAGMLGFAAGFVAPHIGRARAEQAPIGDDDGNPPTKQCTCPTFSCTASDGMRSVDSGCLAKCPTDQAPICHCGKCGDEGRIEKPNSCYCKSPE